MAYNIPQELMIRLNKYQTNVEEKDKIIKNIESYNNPRFLEYYNKSIELALKNNPRLKIDDVIDILECSNNKINRLKGIDKISEVVNEVKKDVNNLNNIEVIFTPYYINDKNKNGFRYDITYIKIQNELYEVRNVERIKAFLGNKEILKDFSEYEVIKFIKENSDLIKTNYLENDENKITSEEVEEEINKESDLRVRNALLHHKDDVVKEREKLQEHINKNEPASIVKYGINSNEERLYFVGDKIIKFVGKNREMQVLNSRELENLKSDEFNQERGYQKEIEPEKYNDLNDFNSELLEQLIDKTFKEEELTSEENDLITSFIEIYLDRKEDDMEDAIQFEYIANKWYENSTIDKNNGRELSNQKMEQLYERMKTYRKNIVLTKEFDSRGFITIFAVLETGLVVGLITALVLLFK